MVRQFFKNHANSQQIKFLNREILININGFNFEDRLPFSDTAVTDVENSTAPVELSRAKISEAALSQISEVVSAQLQSAVTVNFAMFRHVSPNIITCKLRKIVTVNRKALMSV